MSIDKPELTSFLENRLVMFVTEDRIAREIYWAGLGFQVWCQLLTHVSRCSDSDVLVVDEPEVYLHPEVQRRLLGILRKVRPNIVLATHSVEILSEADPSEILLVDKLQRSACRLRDIEGVQQALKNIGSIQNLTLTELARNRRLLFVEGLHDYKIIRMFARMLGLAELAAGNGMVALESGGFESWSKIEALAWGFRNTLGAALSVAAVYDRDYRCDEELAELKSRLEKQIDVAHFHQKKEIENYLLLPDVLERAKGKALREQQRQTGGSEKAGPDILDTLELATGELRADCRGQYVSEYCTYFRSSGRAQAILTTEALTIFDRKWSKINSRLDIVPGKAVLRAVRDRLQGSYGISLTDWRIIECYRAEDVPEDLAGLLHRLDGFRGRRETK